MNELVDDPNASHISALALDRWESRLEDIFAGRPYDMLDAALSDTVARFPVDIQARTRAIDPWIHLLPPYIEEHSHHIVSPCCSRSGT